MNMTSYICLADIYRLWRRNHGGANPCFSGIECEVEDMGLGALRGRYANPAERKRVFIQLPAKPRSYPSHWRVTHLLTKENRKLAEKRWENTTNPTGPYCTMDKIYYEVLREQERE